MMGQEAPALPKKEVMFQTDVDKDLERAIDEEGEVDDGDDAEGEGVDEPEDEEVGAHPSGVQLTPLLHLAFPRRFSRPWTTVIR